MLFDGSAMYCTISLHRLLTLESLPRLDLHAFEAHRLHSDAVALASTANDFQRSSQSKHCATAMSQTVSGHAWPLWSQCATSIEPMSLSTEPRPLRLE
jgi:purine nucleoside permease